MEKDGIETMRTASPGECVVISGVKYKVKLCTINSTCGRCSLDQKRVGDRRCVYEKACMGRFRPDRQSVLFEEVIEGDVMVASLRYMDDVRDVIDAGGYDMDKLLSDDRTSLTSSQRNAVMNVLHSVYGYRINDIATMMSRARCTVSVIVGHPSDEFVGLKSKVVAMLKNRNETNE